jgi:RNA polymerase sigma-70 factor (ECF subfamily)
MAALDLAAQIRRSDLVSARRVGTIRAAHDPDTALVERARVGDRGAFEELVRRHQRAIYAVVSRMLFSRDEVDDLVSEAFVQAYLNLGKFRGEASFGTWIHRIAVNLSLKRIKKLGRIKASSLEDMQEHLGDLPDEQSALRPAESAEREEQERRVREAVMMLPPKHRAVVSLHYFQDLSCEQIAETLGCSVGTVWSRLHYAMRKLRPLLEDLWPEAASGRE